MTGAAFAAGGSSAHNIVVATDVTTTEVSPGVFLTFYSAGTGAIKPSSLGGAAINSFGWEGIGSWAASGTLTLILAGNTGTGTHSATVNGSSLGASGAGSYNSGANVTTYSWSSISNPFGTVNGAKLPCRVS